MTILAASNQRARNQLLLRRSLRIASFLLLLGAWEWAGQTGERLLLPPLSSVLASFWDLTVSGRLPIAMLISNEALVLGLAVALIVGVPAGILMGRIPALDRIFGVYVDILIVTPMVAMMPIVIVALGLGLVARVVIVFLFSVVVIVANTRTGARGVNPALIEMAQSFGAGGLRMWLMVLLPGMLPALAAMVRLAIARAVIGMVIVELSLVAVGIGGLILDASSAFQTATVFAGTLAVVLESLLLIWVASWIEHKIAPKGLYGTNT